MTAITAHRTRAEHRGGLRRPSIGLGLVVVLLDGVLLSLPDVARAESPASSAPDALPPGSFEGKASVRIAAGNVVSARRRALAGARRAAVELAIAALLDEQKRVALRRPLRQRVLSDPARFVSTYKVLEERTAGDRYEVRILARCRMVALRRVIAAIDRSPPASRAVSRPSPGRRAVVLKVEGEPSSAAGGATAALRALVSRQLVAELRRVGLDARGGDGRSSAATGKGLAPRRLVARLAITAGDPVRGLGLQAARARLEVTGDLASSRGVEAWGVGTSPDRAAMAAARAAALRLGPALIKALGGPASKRRNAAVGGQVVRLRGVERFEQLRVVCRMIRTDRGAGCSLRRIGPDEQDLLIRSRRRPQELARWLDGRTFGSIRLQRITGARQPLSFRVDKAPPAAPAEDTGRTLLRGP